MCFSWLLILPGVVCPCVDLRPPPPLWAVHHWLQRAAVGGWQALVWTPLRSLSPEASVWRKCQRTLLQMFYPPQWLSWCFSKKHNNKVDVMSFSASLIHSRKPSTGSTAILIWSFEKVWHWKQIQVQLIYSNRQAETLTNRFFSLTIQIISWN